MMNEDKVWIYYIENRKMRALLNNFFSNVFHYSPNLISDILVEYYWELYYIALQFSRGIKCPRKYLGK